VRLLVALGGNALLPRGVAPDAAVQVEHVEQAAPALAALTQAHELVLTHGNGPQVGMLALESDADALLERPYPFDALVAETQGLIGYWLQRSIRSAGSLTPIVSLVTQTEVDPADPAFATPAKFVGPCYPEDVARRLAADRSWTIARDGAAWRRTVASPAPIRVLETEIVRQLVDSGVTVVCAGGGGCPVVAVDGRFEGVEAVVDKDLVAAALAVDLSVDLLVMVTDVSGVFLDHGTPRARLLRDVSVADLARLELPAGSMGPKADAACRFAKETGKPAVIGALDDLADLVAGGAGTVVRP
jgi:carbamate kinase